MYKSTSGKSISEIGTSFKNSSASPQFTSPHDMAVTFLYSQNKNK